MQRTEYALGTVITFEIRPGSRRRTGVTRALRRASAELHRADEIFSTWKPDSPMSKLRRDELCLAQAPPEVAEVLARCVEARRLSHGWYDPWAAPGGVEPTQLARGWALGQALEVLRHAGVGGALLVADGTAVAFGRPEAERLWRVKVQGLRVDRRSPSGSSTIELPVGVETPSMLTVPCTVDSAGAVANIVAARPTDRLRSATVTGPDPALANALAVGLLAAGKEGLAFIDHLRGYGALVMDRGGLVRVAGEFPSAVFADQQPVSAMA